MQMIKNVVSCHGHPRVSVSNIDFFWRKMRLNSRMRWVDYVKERNIVSTHRCRTVKQLWRGGQRPPILQINHKASYLQGLCVPKLNMWGFWTFGTLKLTNFETRFWTRDTCHVGSEDTWWKPLSSRWFKALEFFNLLKRQKSYCPFSGGV